MTEHEIFRPESKTIREIFGDAQAFYQMPDYQRPYSWEDEQVDQLWDDIYTAYNNNKEDKEIDKNYFLGSMILIPNGKAFDVVDGQQRLTTLTILFCVIRDLFPSLDNIKLVKNSIIDFVQEEQRLKLRTNLNHQNEFEEEIIKKLKWPKQFTKKDKKEKKFINSALIFKEKLSEIETEEDVIGFVDYLFNKVRLIKIVCSDAPFAIKLFQVLNTRGLDLSAADLIKSLLLSRLSDDKRPPFMATWGQIEESCKSINLSLTEILTYYEYYRLASNPKQTLYEELNNVFKGKDSNEIIYDLKIFVDNYKEIYYYQDKVIFSFYYLRHQIYWRSILTTAKQLNFQDFDKLAKILRDYYFLYWIGGYISSKIKQTSFNIIKWLKEGKTIQFIENELNVKIKNDDVIKRAKSNLEENVYGEGWLKPLLIMIEYNQVDDCNLLNFINLEKEIHIEHILPDGYKQFEYWKDLYSEDEANYYLNRIHNLTLLSGRKNISASNNPYPEKLKSYNGKGVDGLTGFRITQFIFDNYENWNKADILNRKIWLSGEIERILGHKLLEINNTNIEN
jgi:uncharacterized protein with ParB-like and HNH nuclease domain